MTNFLGLLILSILCSIVVVVSEEINTEVQVLTDDTFHEATASGTWLLEFYAPWCGHCKKLNPILDEAGPLLGPDLRIGKVDCTENKAIATEFGIRSYPSLRFKINNGEMKTYEGERTLESFIEFSKILKSSAITTLGSKNELQDYLKTHTKAFALSVSEEDGPSTLQTKAFEPTAEEMKYTSRFVLLAGELSQLLKDTNTIAKIELGEQPVYLDINESTPVGTVAEIIKNNDYALMTELGAHNFRKLGNLGKLVVIAAIDPTKQTESNEFIKGIKEVARGLDAKVSAGYIFGYLDGIKWASVVSQFNVEQSDLPKMFVLNMSEDSKFYEDPEVDEIDEIETFLIDIHLGKVPAQREGIAQMTKRFGRKLKDWYPYSLFFIFPILLLFATCCVPGFFDSLVGPDEEDDKPDYVEEKKQEKEPKKEK